MGIIIAHVFYEILSSVNTNSEDGFRTNKSSKYYFTDLGKYICILLHSFTRTLEIKRKCCFINCKRSSNVEQNFQKSNHKISGLSKAQKSRTLSIYGSDLSLEILSNIYAYKKSIIMLPIFNTVV
jgi:hypothetical protein